MFRCRNDLIVKLFRVLVVWWIIRRHLLLLSRSSPTSEIESFPRAGGGERWSEQDKCQAVDANDEKSSRWFLRKWNCLKCCAIIQNDHVHQFNAVNIYILFIITRRGLKAAKMTDVTHLFECVQGMKVRIYLLASPSTRTLLHLPAYCTSSYTQFQTSFVPLLWRAEKSLFWRWKNRKKNWINLSKCFFLSLVFVPILFSLYPLSSIR